MGRESGRRAAKGHRLEFNADRHHVALKLRVGQFIHKAFVCEITDKQPDRHYVNSVLCYRSQHGLNVMWQSSDEDGELFMSSFCSGQSLVIGPTAAEFQVWLCDFASCQVQRACVLLTRKHAAICLQFEYVDCSPVTDPHILFSVRRLLHLDICGQTFLNLGRLGETVSFDASWVCCLCSPGSCAHFLDIAKTKQVPA